MRALFFCIVFIEIIIIIIIKCFNFTDGQRIKREDDAKDFFVFVFFLRKNFKVFVRDP